MLGCNDPMILLVLFAVALLVRAAAGLAFSGPAYPDSYYYFNVASQLAAGNGLSVDYIWNFVDVGGALPSDPTLPIPSNAHWMPLAALVQVPFIWLFGSNPAVAAVPLWIIGALAVPLTYLIARDAGLDKRLALAAGLLAAVPGALTPFFGQTDNFGLFMTLGALSLWLCARGLRGDPRSFVLGGLIVGVATLARSDAVLLGIPFALGFARELWADWRRGATRVIGWAAALGCAALFAVVVAPWLYRQLDVFGSIAPSAANGRILWISDYSELYSIGSPATPSTLLADGVGSFLASRVGGLLSALAIFAVLPLVLVLAPLAVVAAWARRRDWRFWPYLVYALGLFAASGLLFAVHVPHGTFIHSAVALLPHTFVLVMIGVQLVVGWAARRRRWNVSTATAFFAYGAVVVAVVGAALQTASTVANWREVRDVQQTLAAELLKQAQPGDRVMSADAGAYKYLTGLPGIVTPNDPLPTIESALRAYDVRWLVVESEQIVPALEPVLTGPERPSWLSTPLAVVAAPAGPVAATDTMPTATPFGALFAVCLADTDMRCSR